MKLQSINPYTEEMMHEFDYISVEEAMKAAKSLKENKEWPQLDASDKIGAIKDVSKQLKKIVEEYARTISLEMGKPIKEARAEIEKCAWLCDYFAENAEQFLEDEVIETENRKSYITLDPLGVVLGVMPWNFPFWQVYRFAIPALIVGNRVVVKHSSNVPQCALKIEESFGDLPYKNLFLPGKDVEKIIESPYVDAVSITGSTAAGAKVAEAAGRHIKKTVLELGGSDPFIVLSDADLDACCTTAISARLGNAGQSCISAKRFIVMDSIVNDFTELFVEKMKKLKMGDPLDENTNIGPLARNDLRLQLDDIVKRSVNKGAKIVIGGRIPSMKGFFYEPTIMTNITENMPVLKEETFGPVAPIIPVKNESEAIRIANSTEYGLGASIWTRNIEKAQQLAKRIEAGFVAINSQVKSDPRLPFGGVKRSGYGRELSKHALREFANVKTVTIK